MDPILQSRQTDIQNQIRAIHSRAKAVEELHVTLESQIEQAYKKAMSDLQAITDKKLNILMGDELELKRQLGEMTRLQDFLKYQEEGDATTYLFNWSRHEMFRERLRDFKFFRNAIDVQLDAKVIMVMYIYLMR